MLEMLEQTPMGAGGGAIFAPPFFVTERKPIFVTGVSDERFAFFAARQKQPLWCWAACIQMLIGFRNVFATQEEIVARVFGWPVNGSANAGMILRALRGVAFDTEGGPVMIEAICADDLSDIFVDLKQGEPVMVGVKMPGGTGHALVATAMTYTIDDIGAIVPLSVILRDPSPFDRSPIEWSWAEFQARCDLIVRIRVGRI